MKTYKSMSYKFSLKKEETEFNKAKIKSSDDAAEYARQFYFDDIAVLESFFMISLNNANNTNGYVKISQGGITGTMVDVRVLAKYALESLAVAVILVHNHPSGTLKPSEADKRITEKIKRGLELLDIKVLDHVILTEEEHYSFADEGIL